MRTHNKTIFVAQLFAIAMIAIYVAFFTDHKNYDAILGYCILVINIMTMIKVRHNWYLLFVFSVLLIVITVFAWLIIFPV